LLCSKRADGLNGVVREFPKIPRHQRQMDGKVEK
jgi:hypothetical protein